MYSQHMGEDDGQIQEHDDLYNKVILPKRERDCLPFARQFYISVSPEHKKDDVEKEIKNWVEENNKILQEEDRQQYSGLMIIKGPLVIHFLECIFFQKNWVKSQQAIRES